MSKLRVLLIASVLLSSLYGARGVIQAEYGAWRSPITSEFLTDQVVHFIPPIMVDPKHTDTVYWTEIRPNEGGRGVVASWQEGDDEIKTWTPRKFNVFTLVHYTGGGAFFVHNRRVYFSNVYDQRLYVQKSECDEDAEPLTPEFPGLNMRYADGHFITKRNRIVIVREDHTGKLTGQRKEEENTIVIINPETKEQHVLVRGADFYMWPRASPDGKRLLWIQWYHPYMPWDNTELWMAEFNEDMKSLKNDSFLMLARGSSILQPSWTNSNRPVYVSDRTNWYNLYAISKYGTHENVLPQNSDLAIVPWNLGHYQYSLKNGNFRRIAALFDGTLFRINGVNGRYTKIPTDYTRHYFIAHGGGNYVYSVAASTDKKSSVIRVNMRTGKTDIVREGSPGAETLDKGYISIPENVEFKTANGDTVYANYYPPKNKDYEGPTTSLPPLLVKMHAGPTARSYAVLRLNYQYFTSRGFGILDVNYRGSTGKGRAYRQSLYKNWGIYDPEDAVYGALHMVNTGRADRNRLAIGGESAGGYAVLSTLVFWPDVFKAGASYYGIGDVELIVKQTHKLESHYIDHLIGPYDEYKDVIQQRSPIHFVSNMKAPTIFFHGARDHIVPPSQSQLMFDELKRKNIATSILIFPGERHGLRMKDNIQKAIDAEFYFYSVVFGFQAADNNVNITIENPPTST